MTTIDQLSDSELQGLTMMAPGALARARRLGCKRAVKLWRSTARQCKQETQRRRYR